MKSLIGVLFVFLISQTVCSESNEKFNVYEDRGTVILRIIDSLKNFFNIGNACQSAVLYEAIRNKPTINESEIELKEYLSICMGPKYVELVDKLHEFDLKFIKLRSEMSFEEAKELHEMINASERDNCDQSLQLASCFFSETEMLQTTKDTSYAAFFLVQLFNGNDKQCEIVTRIVKCALNSLKTCESKIFSQQIEYFFKIMMKLIVCKFYETSVYLQLKNIAFTTLFLDLDHCINNKTFVAFSSVWYI